MPTAVQPRITLKGIPPTVEVAEIKEELEKYNLNKEKIRQIVRKEKTTGQIQQKYPVFVITFTYGMYIKSRKCVIALSVGKNIKILDRCSNATNG